LVFSALLLAVLENMLRLSSFGYVIFAQTSEKLKSSLQKFAIAIKHDEFVRSTYKPTEND